MVSIVEEESVVIDNQLVVYLFATACLRNQLKLPYPIVEYWSRRQNGVHRVAVSNVLLGAGGPNPHGLKMLMFGAELSVAFKDPANWALLCEFAMRVDSAHDISSDFERELRNGASLRAVLEDNFILGAMAVVRLGLHRDVPAVAWAASNKHSFPGLTEGKVPEIAVMRFLHWAGADVSMPDDATTMTPLHYMAHVKYGQASHPGAVRWLLEAGANPNAKNKNGDTPMAYLCGVSVWSDAQRETFLMLLQTGCDPMENADDGSTPLGLLRLVQKSARDSSRQALIEALVQTCSSARMMAFAQHAQSSE